MSGIRYSLLSILLVLLSASAANAATIYSTSEDGTALISIDTATGVATTIGISGTTETWATAFTPDGTLWTIINGFSNGQLATFNMTTGAATAVGTPMGTADVIALEASTNGALFAAGFDGSFYGVNTTTGQLTPIGALGFTSIMDMAFDNLGRLYAVASDNIGGANLFTINTVTGAGTLVCSISGTPGEEMGLMFDPATNLMYTTIYTSPSFLYQVNPLNCAAVQIGTGLGVSFPHGGDIFGIPVTGYEVPVPTLSGWNMMLMIILLALMAAFTFRRAAPFTRR